MSISLPRSPPVEVRGSGRTSFLRAKPGGERQLFLTFRTRQIDASGWKVAPQFGHDGQREGRSASGLDELTTTLALLSGVTPGTVMSLADFVA